MRTLKNALKLCGLIAVILLVGYVVFTWGRL
jgi:hypothetical protein